MASRILIFIDDVRFPADRGLDEASYQQVFVIRHLEQFEFVLDNLDYRTACITISFDYHVGYANGVVVLGIQFIRVFLQACRRHDFEQYQACFHSGQQAKNDLMIGYYQQHCAPACRDQVTVLAVPDAPPDD